MRLSAAAAMVALVAACEDRAGTVAAPPPAPLAELEGATGLPYAQPAGVEYAEPDRGYQWAERAYGLQRTFYDAPPDYGFYYDEEVSPYVWETADDWALYAEPWEGDYRYYYYEPGAARPYFIRDRDYGYAFDPAGLLIAVFYSDGRYAPRDVVLRNAPLAGRYYARGYDLRQTSRKARRVAVQDGVWVAEAPRVIRSADPWLRAARDDRDWRHWRERDGNRELRRFEGETRRRQDAAAQWRERAARHKVAAVEHREVSVERQAQGARPDRLTPRGQRNQSREASAQAQDEGRRGPPAKAPRNDQGWVAGNERREASGPAQFDARRKQIDQQRGQAEIRERHVRSAEARQSRGRDPQQNRVERQAERPQPQARAPAAADRGQPAAARERGRGEPGKGRERHKD